MHKDINERIHLDKEEAIDLLARGERVHTYLQCGMLIGADWDRGDVLELIDECGAQLGGPQCIKVGHGLVIFRNDGPSPVFVAHDPDGLKRMQKLKEALA